MSILDLIQKGNGRQQAKAAPSLSPNVSVHDALDRHVLSDVKRDSPMWAELFDRPIDVPADHTYDGSEDLYDDVWMSLHHHGDAAVKESDQVRPSRQLGRTALDALQRHDDFQSVKARSRGNSTMSSIAFGAMAGKLREGIADGTFAGEAERSEQAAQAEQMLDATERDLSDLRAEAKAQLETGQPLDPTTRGEIRAATAERNELRAKLEQIIDEQAQASSETAAALAPVAAKAARAGEQAAEQWGDIAAMDATTLKNARPDEAIALMEAWAQVPNFQEFIKLVGRSVRLWRALDARKVVDGNDEITGVELGNDLTRTLPTELMQLGHPLLRRKFYRQYMDEELLQFATHGIDKAAEGPGAMLLDMSGSMKKDMRFLRALAMVLGFVKLMHAKRRDAVVFPFNGDVKQPVIFRAQQPLDMKALMKLACLRPTGGTDIYTAVLAAERAINTSTEFAKADIVILTDGQYTYIDARDEPVKKRLADAGIRTHGVAIDHTPDTTGFLLQFCDDAIRADDLTSAAGHLVNAVA
jgi:uncharacterized protein with von Willebrand factor type A (vWA) domain